VRKQLEVLSGWDKNIKDNYAKIDILEHRLTQLSSDLHSFTSDDSFTRSRQNFTQLYQILMGFKEKIEKQFEPELAQTRIDKTKFATIDKFDKCWHKIMEIDVQVDGMDG
jgi:hypothetical protein